VAKLLYLLGQFSAKRAWIVLVTWVLVLGGAATAALTLGGGFSANLTLSGTPAQQVIDDLKKNFPDASRGSAQVVFTTTDGKPFTDAQRDEIAERLNEATQLAGVSGVVNPFETQAEKDASAQEITDGNDKVASAPEEFASAQQKIDDGWAEYNSGIAQINANQAQVNSGFAQIREGQATITENRAQIDAAIAQLEAAGAPAEQIDPLRVQQQQLIAAQADLDVKRAELTAAQQQLTAARAQAESGRIELLNGQSELDAAKAELPAQIEKLSWGNVLLTVSESYRTVSADGSTAIATILFDKPLAEVSPTVTASVTDVLGTAGPDATGPAAIAGIDIEYSKELVESLDGLLGPGEIIGLVIAAIVLVVMLGSLIAAGLPLITALIGVAMSVFATLALASVIEMNSTTPTLGVMLGLAVGIDYSLFILNRHRKQLKQGMPVRQSIALANGTSGSAVFFAGLTVMIALLALNLTGVGFLGVMGTVAAGAIFIAVLAAVTFTPAVASLVGMRALSKRERKKLAAAQAPKTTQAEPPVEKEVWAAKRPVWASIIAVIVLAVVALPLGSLRLGLPDGSSEPIDSTQYRAYSITADKFGAGSNGLITAVVTLPEAVSGDDLLRTQSEIAAELDTITNVEAVLPAAVSEDETRLIFAVQPSDGPASESTEQVVRDLRALEPELATNFDASLGVTGIAAVNIDISKKLSDALPLYLGVVLGLSMLLLILVFRSILLPLVASVGFLLTVLASLGAVVAVYQRGWFGEVFGVYVPGPILSFLPTLLIGILFGLAMDYQLFIATGIREAYVHGYSPRAAITHGVRAGRAVVIAAAIIMISVFGSFAFGHLAVIKPIGFGLAIGILFDAFLVRLLLVPALLRLFGKAAWWLPKWLDKIMPDMDIEGAKLERENDRLTNATSAQTGTQHAVRSTVKPLIAKKSSTTLTE
jgi:RND superfamily putative drug exporter